MDATIVSVIMSGIVAVAGILITPLMNLITERAKWSRERKAAKAEMIDKFTTELLEELANLISRHHTTESTYRKLLSKHYAWERAIWPHCKDADRQRVRCLRAEFEAYAKTLGTGLRDDAPDATSEILALTHIASERVK